MKSERRSDLKFCMILSLMIVVPLLFLPRPIVAHVDNCSMFYFIMYNDFYQELTGHWKQPVPYGWTYVVDDDCKIEIKADNIYVTDYGMNSGLTADRIIVADYDIKEILRCLSCYKEFRTLKWNNGGMGAPILEFWIFGDRGLRDIVLGSRNFSFRDTGSQEFKILEADKLKAELLDLIDIKGIIEAPGHATD